MGVPREPKVHNEKYAIFYCIYYIFFPMHGRETWYTQYYLCFALYESDFSRQILFLSSHALLLLLTLRLSEKSPRKPVNLLILEDMSSSEVC